jgi:seryl-tRNA synthetase
MLCTLEAKIVSYKKAADTKNSIIDDTNKLISEIEKAKSKAKEMQASIDASYKELVEKLKGSGNTLPKPESIEETSLNSIISSISNKIPKANKAEALQIACFNVNE